MSDIRIRHFHRKSNGRLIATIATHNNADGTVMMGVARCNPIDNPSREEGREIAISRLQRFFLFKNKMLSGEELQTAREEIRRKLVADISRPDLIARVIKKNPFTRGNCEFGIPVKE